MSIIHTIYKVIITDFSITSPLKSFFKSKKGYSLLIPPKLFRIIVFFSLILSFFIYNINTISLKYGDNMTRPTGLNCFIYLRKSRKDIEEEKKAKELGQIYDTLERHRRQLYEIARRDGLNIVGEPFEEIVTGESIMERPKMKLMLQQIEAGLIDAILVMDVDRLGRGDMFDAGYIFRILKYSETLIITPDTVIDPNSESAELNFGIKSMIAREELKAINKRMQRGRRESVKEGKSITRIPYGYLRDSNLKLYPNPDTAPIVVTIFEKIATGFGRRALANELNRLGIKPPMNRREWGYSSISRIIKNEVYLGHIIWGKHKSVKNPTTRKYVQKKLPPEQWVRYENAHTPLVSQDLFDRANHALAERYIPPVVDNKGLSNPLAGLVFCEICGYTMARIAEVRKQKRHQLRCVKQHCRDKQKGAILSVVEQKILDGLEEILSTFVADHSKIVKQQESSVIPIHRGKLKQKEEELNELLMQRNELHTLLEKKIYTIEIFLERQAILNKNIQDVQETISQLIQEIKEAEERENRKNEIAPKIKSILEEYQKTDDVIKKNILLKSVLEKVTYFRKKEWREIDRFELQLVLRL